MTIPKQHDGTTWCSIEHSEEVAWSRTPFLVALAMRPGRTAESVTKTTVRVVQRLRELCEAVDSGLSKTRAIALVVQVEAVDLAEGPFNGALVEAMRGVAGSITLERRAAGPQTNVVVVRRTEDCDDTLTLLSDAAGGFVAGATIDLTGAPS